MKQTIPEVSIILNAYNGDKYISEQISSILNQTYPDYELLIIDDCSTDETIKIIKNNFNDNRIKIYVNEKNLGLNESFKKGLSLCKGNYITLADNDNYWLPTRLEEQINCFEQHPDAVMVFHDSYLTNDNLDITSTSFQKDLRGKPWAISRVNTTTTEFLNLLDNNVVPGVTLMFKRELLKNALLLPKNMIHDYWLALNAANLSKIYYIDKQLIKYRQHQNNMVGAFGENNLFYIRSLVRNESLKKYIENRQGFIDNLKLLKTLTPKGTRHEVLIDNQVKLLQYLVDAAKSKNIGELIQGIAKAKLFCFRTRRFRYLKYLAFIGFNRIATRFA